MSNFFNKEEIPGIPDAWFLEPYPAFAVPLLRPDGNRTTAMIIIMIDPEDRGAARLYMAAPPPSRTAKLLLRVTSLNGPLFKQRVTQEFHPLIMLVCDRLHLRLDSSIAPQMCGFKRDEYDLVDNPLSSTCRLVAIPTIPGPSN